MIICKQGRWVGRYWQTIFYFFSTVFRWSTVSNLWIIFIQMWLLKNMMLVVWFRGTELSSVDWWSRLHLELSEYIASKLHLRSNTMLFHFFPSIISNSVHYFAQYIMCQFQLGCLSFSCIPTMGSPAGIVMNFAKGSTVSIVIHNPKSRHHQLHPGGIIPTVTD